jgi:DNA-directed RNA polymerase subunit RPC12/RpoP
MSGVVLRASGYTWKCPECGRENYTGPAPELVRCKRCNGEFQVRELHHRRDPDASSRRKKVRKPEQLGLLPLLPLAPPIAAEDEIPF